MATDKTRNLKGKWKPGQSGNPRGRPKGSGLSAKLRKAIEQDAPDILTAVIAQAKAGDMQAAKVLLDRVVPALKPQAQTVTVPGMEDAQGLADKALAALSAAAGGDIPADTAAQLVQAIGTVGRVVEIDDLERRIAALEKQHEAKN